MSNVKIISLPPERWQEAKDIRLASLEQDPSAFGSSLEYELAFDDSVWQERVTNAYNKHQNITLYAELDGVLVGMMGAHWTNRDKFKHVAHIYGVYVDPVARGQGIAAQLLAKLLDDLNAVPQLTKVNLSVTTVQTAAIALYQKFGFETIGIAHHELLIDDVYYDMYHMEKLF